MTSLRSVLAAAGTISMTIGLCGSVVGAEGRVEDTPGDLARRYLNAAQKQDKEAVKKLWVTEKQLAAFLESPAGQAFSIPKQRRNEYVTEAMKQQTRRLERQLEKLERPRPQFEIIEVLPDKTLRDVMCNGVDVKLRDTATQTERQIRISQESVKIEGRWYFFERP